MVIFIIFNIYEYFVFILTFYYNIVIIIFISINNILTAGVCGSVFYVTLSVIIVNIIILLNTITINFILF